MSNQENIFASFTQCPNIVLYGLPNLPMQDRWALLALMGQCWDRSKDQHKTLKELEGPYKLSLREISTITGVKHTILRNKGGKDPREGVLDRLQSIGYVTVFEARPIDDVTGKPGRLQTYIYIHLEKIWQDNQAFTERWNRPSGKLVKSSTFLADDPTTVTDGNVTVNDVNSSVNHVNVTVTDVNMTVNELSSKSRQYKSNTVNTKKERENTDSPEKENADSGSDDSLSLSESSLKEETTNHHNTLSAEKETNNESDLSQHKPSRSQETAPEASEQSQASERKETRKEARARWYSFFNGLAAKHDITDKLARTSQNDAIVDSIIEAEWQEERVAFVYEDIWNDPDTFWVQHRNSIKTVVSQYPKRIGKFKQQPSSGGFIVQTDGAQRWAEKKEQKKLTRQEYMEHLRRTTTPGHRNFTLERMEEEDRQQERARQALSSKEAYQASLESDPWGNDILGPAKQPITEEKAAQRRAQLSEMLKAI